MPLPNQQPKQPFTRPTAVGVTERVDVGQRVSISLIALSLGLISLALGAAFFSAAGPAALLVAPTVSLSALPSSATALTLTWTAPGDDGSAGQAASYDIRYATSAITADGFTSATAVTAPPVPQPAGSTESYTVTNLTPATTYFFALRSSDEAGNVSDLSNVATATTAALPQACVPTYECSSWSACVNGQQTRTCSVSNGCSSNLDEPVTTQACTPPATGGQPVQVIKHIIAVGVGPGTIPVVRVVNPTTRKAERQWLVFRRRTVTGTNVAAGDIDGNHRVEVIVGSGAGSDPLVKVYTTGGSLVGQFNPYPASRGVGASVASADVDGDGVDEILTIPAKSAAQLRIFRYDPATRRFNVLAQTFVYSRSQRQGFTVAAGDLDLDGRADIIVAPRTFGRSVTILRYTAAGTIQTVKRFSPYPIAFSSGLTLAIGDTDGNGRGEIVTAPGPGYYAHVKIFDLQGHLLRSFLPATTAFTGGVDLTALDVNTDGRDEVITGTYRNGDPGLRVFRYNGVTKKFERIQSYFVFPRSMKSGLRISSR